MYSKKLLKLNGFRRSDRNGARIEIFSPITRSRTVVANFLGHPLTDSVGNLLMDSIAVLLGHLVTLLVGFIPALLVLNSSALFLGYIDALLLGNLVAFRIRHLPLPLLLDVDTGVVRVGLAGAFDGNPDLGCPLAFPVIFAVILVLCVALCFSVVFVFCSVLLYTYIFVDCLALAIRDRCTFLSGHIEALFFVERIALVDVDCVAHLVLSLYVFRGPGRCVLGPALDCTGRRSSLLLWILVVTVSSTTTTNRSILRCSQSSYSKAKYDNG